MLNHPQFAAAIGVPTLSPNVSSPPITERRRSRRSRAEFAARLRPYYSVEGVRQEIRATWNMSRDGIYFIAEKPIYAADMNLYVACPCSDPHAPGDGEAARVVRVDALPDGRFGVAVIFLRSAGFHRSSAAPSGKEFHDRKAGIHPMKTLIVAAVFLLISLPAHAQASGARAVATRNFTNLPGSGAPSNGGGGYGGGGMGGVSLPSMPSTSGVVTAASPIVVRGTEAYAPSHFLTYHEAIKSGIAALAFRPKTVAEAAAEARAARARLLEGMAGAKKPS